MPALRLPAAAAVELRQVTYDQEQALALSNRICLMNQAQIEQIGTPQEIYERPATVFATDLARTNERPTLVA